MIWRPEAPADPRTYETIFDQIQARRPGYVPEWLPGERSSGAALSWVTARYLQAILQRLNQAPDKNLLAFLDCLGLRLVPAQAARAPIVFQLAAGAASGSVPTGTGVSAPPPEGSPQPISFETEQTAGLAAGNVAQVVTLWPGRDEFIDHTEAYVAGEPIRLFERMLREPTHHHLYLAHDAILTLAGNVQVNVDVELTQGAGEHLDMLWQYWDGQVWREFLSMNPACTTEKQEKLDSTAGLTRSGRYVLKSECAESARTTVNGIDGSWIRGTLTERLPPDPDKPLPEVESVRLSTSVNQGLQPVLTATRPETQTGISTTHTFHVSGVATTEAGVALLGARVRVTSRTNPANTHLSSSIASANGAYSVEAGPVPSEDLYEISVLFRGLESSVELSISNLEPNVDLMLRVDGLTPDKAFSDGEELDLSKPFFPLGLQPRPGSTFYFTSEEVFTKPGAALRIYMSRTTSPFDEAALSGGAPVDHSVHWEYWNGRQWAVVAQSRPPANTLSAGPLRALAFVSATLGQGAGGEPLLDFTETEMVDLIVPDDMEPVKVNEEETLWMRARMVRGGYGLRQTVTWNDGNSGTNTFTYVVPTPPVVAEFRMGYAWTHGPFPAERVLAYNDFQYQDHTEAAHWPGNSFAPLARVSDVTPALYLGLSEKPPSDAIGLYLDIEEEPSGDAGPALVWESWDGVAWRNLPVTDDTRNLRAPGITSLLTGQSAPLARFGVERYWVRARLKEDGPPGEALVRAIHLNAVWASQRQTIRNAPLGASSGMPDQLFQILQTPVLPGERIEVRELAGPRAHVEWRLLASEVFAGDAEKVRALERLLAQEGPEPEFTLEGLRVVRERNKRVVETWVRWEARKHLFSSGPNDRHYSLDAAMGRLRFGDGVNGMIPPSGAAIQAREYKSGGGAIGNVAAQTVTQLLGAVAGVEAVFNPAAAEGGADSETIEQLTERGPQTVRHRGRAVLPSDFETLAREASPAVGFARALPGRNAEGRQTPGAVTLVIVPASDEPRPWPTTGLREHVRRFLADRATADMAGCAGIHVTGPVYFPVDVTATLAPVDFSAAGVVEQRARAALETFLHPLNGGPGGKGWRFGRDVHRSDVAAVLESVDGVDYVEEVDLLRDGVPRGETLAVSDEEIVVAGDITLKLRAAGR